MEHIPVQFSAPSPSYSMAPPPLPTMVVHPLTMPPPPPPMGPPPPPPMGPPPPHPPLTSYQSNMQTQSLPKQITLSMPPGTNTTWGSPDWRGPMPRPVRNYNQRQPWRGNSRFKTAPRFFPYARQMTPYSNNFSKKQHQGGFAVPWPPKRIKVVGKTPGKTNNAPTLENESENGVKKKGGKKRSMSEKYPTKPWNREDAEKALAVENKYRCLDSSNAVMIRFPDPELSKEIVRNYHPGIKSVHFQAPSGQRYCFVQLREGANVDEAIEDLNLVEFGNGKLIAERKTTMKEDDIVITPECIDPYTLYVGNLPVSITANRIREQFPNSSRVDIGFAQKMKFTRWAFIRFENVDLAIEAFKSAINLEFDSRSVVLRFRRATAKQLGINDGAKSVKTEKPEGKESVEVNTSKESKQELFVKKEPTDEDEEEDYEQDIENELDSVMGDVDTYTEFGDDDFDYDVYNMENEEDDDDDDDEEVMAFSTACKTNRKLVVKEEDEETKPFWCNASRSASNRRGVSEDKVNGINNEEDDDDDKDEEEKPFMRNKCFL